VRRWLAPLVAAAAGFGLAAAAGAVLSWPDWPPLAVGLAAGAGVVAAVLAALPRLVAAIVAVLGFAAAVAIPLVLHERLRGEREDVGRDPTPPGHDSRVLSVKDAALLVPSVEDPSRLVFRATGPTPSVELRPDAGVRDLEVRNGRGEPLSPLAPDAPVRFVVWGDCRGGAAIFSRVLDAVRRESPEFAIALGDVVGMAREYQFEILDGHLRDTGIPHFLVPGNHDRDPFGTLRPYARVFGPGTWSFVHRGVLFLGLDTSRGVVDVRDLDRLESAASEFGDGPALLFCHHPPFEPTGRPDKTLPHHPGTIRLRAFVERRRLQVFCSHYHAFDDREPVPGVRQVVTGGAGSTPEGDTPYHLLAVEADRHGALRVRRIDVAPLSAASDLADRLLVFRDEATYASRAHRLATLSALAGLAALLGALAALPRRRPATSAA
jgi:hypothetical protein